MSGYLIHIFRRLFRRPHTDRHLEELKLIYVEENPIDSRKRIEYRYTSYAIGAICLSIIFGCLIGSPAEQLTDGNHLPRPQYSEGTREIELQAQSESGFSENINITLNYKELTEQERDELMKKAMDYLEENCLGENASREEVRSSLNFASSVPGTHFKVAWRSNDPEVINYDGCIFNEEIEEDGCLASVTLVLEDGEKEYQRDLYFRVCPPIYTGKEILLHRITAELDRLDTATAGEDYLSLPEQVDGERILWKENEQEQGPPFVFLGLLAAVFMKVGLERELSKGIKKRESELMIDYPEFISKITLLLGAGMTVKGAWENILKEYEEKKIKRYVYEEMKVTKHQLLMGVPEIRAFEEFGFRCRLMPYLRFSTIISQNIKKGSKGMIPLLEAEANEAFEERKGMAERLGEEASTKLLMPMLGMLIIVLVIVMVPAFMSFGG